MKITEFKRKLGKTIAILVAISLTFASCSADSGDESRNPGQATETKDDANANEQEIEVVQPAVTGLSATIGDGKVLLSWTNPTNEEFSSLEVSYTTEKSSSSKKSLSKTATTYTFSSLSNDTEYTFTVTAISSAKTIGFATIKATPKKITKVLNDPRNIVVNSITETENGCAVNISFTYNGENIIDGTTTAILGYSYSNTFTEVISETKSDVTVENGENTITVNIPNFHPILNETYYFRLGLTNNADNILDSGRYVVGYKYIESGKDTEYLARYVYESKAGEHIKDADEGIAEDKYCVWKEKIGGQYYAIPDYNFVYFTFKSVDEKLGVAYFYANALEGYYIDSSYPEMGSILLPHDLIGKVEINPETNYWRYK